MLEGRIIRGIAGFYYVSVVGSGIYECKAKGIFRKEKIKPLVGDHVVIEVLDETAKEASIVDIFPRKNELIRPAVANVDQAMILFALKSPDPEPMLLDRFLIMMEMQDVPVIIVFNKADLADEAEAEHWRAIYAESGYEVLFISAGNDEGTEAVRKRLHGKTTVAAGPSGVGKSTLTNLMQTEMVMETGSISDKLKRGRHTTRRAELLPLGDDTFLCDTPGFTSLELPFMEKEKLQQYFPEFQPYLGDCRFRQCAHISEPDCAVKDALEEGKISSQRYENYRRMYEDLKEREKRRY